MMSFMLDVIIGATYDLPMSFFMTSPMLLLTSTIMMWLWLYGVIHAIYDATHNGMPDN